MKKISSNQKDSFELPCVDDSGAAAPPPGQLDLFAFSPPVRAIPTRRTKRVSQFDIYQSNMLETAEHVVFKCPRVTHVDFLKCASKCFKSALTNKKAQVDAVEAKTVGKGSIDPD